MQHALIVPSALVVLLAACSEPTTPTEVGGPSAAVVAPNATANRPGTTVIVYDNFQKPGGYTLADYNAKWSTLTLGEMAVQDTRQFDNHTFSISATPFRTGKDSSVLDHATYVQSGAPYAARVLQGQQAAATFHMIDFATGQLFDWFVSGNTAFTLYERLPSSVSGSAEHVGIDKMFTQIIDEVPIAAGVPHTVAIRYSRERHGTLVEYLLDGKRVSKVERVGIPLDAQGVKYSGIYPSLGPGELLRDKINSVTIAHGLLD